MRNHLISDKLILWALALPFILYFLIFSYIPLFGWAMAFVRYIPGVPIFDNTFVGLYYFKNLFSFASDFPRVMVNTLAMSLLGIIVSPCPMILAILLNEVKQLKLRRVFQTATSLPNFVSWIIVYGVFFVLFSIDDGIVNRLLTMLKIGNHPVNPLASSDFTWYFQTLIGLWKSVGWTAIIYLGAISGIDQEQYDAASVDGAGRYQKAIHVTLPGLMPTFVVLLMLQVASLLAGAGFEQVFVFHNALVHSKIEILDYYVYRIGLQQLDFSYATAIGIFKTIVSIILLFSVNGMAKIVLGRNII